jgi:hypothetical protein
MAENTYEPRVLTIALLLRSVGPFASAHELGCREYAV